MRWYKGDIAEAVATSKSRNAIFVVYIEGKDDKSRTLTYHINDIEVSTKLETLTFVCLKLEAGSKPHLQFAELYKNVPVPSMFFIGKTGLPLDVLTDVDNSRTLLERIDKVIQAHGGPILSTTQSAASLTQSFISGEQQTEDASTSTLTVNKPDVVCENGVCHKLTDKELEKKPSDDISIAEQESVSELSKEEKIQRAKELVEKKREEKKLEEEEKEKQKELERRKLGQEVQKLKEWQKDQELKEILEKRKKEKMDDKAARDRILAQIEQDKVDRAAKFGTGTNRQNSPTLETVKTEPKLPTSTPNSARLHFRLPDGSSDVNTFENYTTLQEVRNYIIDNLSLPFRNFSLATTFPKREFTPEDNAATLLDLNLCPTAVILIIPNNAQISLSNQSGGVFGFLWLLFTPIVSIFEFVRNLIYGPPPTVGRTDQSQRTGGTDRNKRSAGENLDKREQQSSSKRRVTESSTVRREGNIHRLSDQQDSDDENNTWNGNSTQQM